MADFTCTIMEESGYTSIETKSFPYQNYESFVGMELPHNEENQAILATNEHSIKLVRVDADGKIDNVPSLKVELYKLSWEWWWDQTARIIPI